MKNIKILLMILFAFTSCDCLSKMAAPSESRVLLSSGNSIHEIILNQSLTLEQKIQAISVILDKDPAAINIQDANGKSALNFATYYKAEPELIEFLIARGADVNLPDRFNVTPLINTMRYEQLRPAQLLLIAGANKDFKTDEGLTASNMARTLKAKRILQTSELNDVIA